MPLAIVTGANRGIGKGVARRLASKDYVVIMTGRNRNAIIDTAQEIRESIANSRVEPFVVDVTDVEAIKHLNQYVVDHFDGVVDVLVNNAGVYLDDWTNDGHIFRVNPDSLRQTFEINTLGCFNMMQSFIPLMVQSKKPARIVNVSSTMGQLETMGGGSVAYRVSKTALNALTKIFAHEVMGLDILVNAVCPGWVKTDMGGGNAPIDIEQASNDIIWACELPKGSPNGVFFRNQSIIPW